MHKGISQGLQYCLLCALITLFGAGNANSAPILVFSSQGETPFDIVATNSQGVQKYYIICIDSNEINVFGPPPTFPFITSISVPGVKKGVYSPSRDLIYVYVYEEECSYIKAISNSTGQILPYSYSTPMRIQGMDVDKDSGVLFSVLEDETWGKGWLVCHDPDNQLVPMSPPVECGRRPSGLLRGAIIPYVFINDYAYCQTEIEDGQGGFTDEGAIYCSVHVYNVSSLPPLKVCEVHVALNPGFMVLNSDETRLYVTHSPPYDEDYVQSMSIIDTATLTSPEPLIEFVTIPNNGLCDPIVMGEGENEMLIAVTLPEHEGGGGTVETEVLYYNLMSSSYFIQTEYNCPLFRLQRCIGWPFYLATCPNDDLILVINIDTVRPICHITSPQGNFVGTVGQEINFSEHSDDNLSDELVIQWDFTENHTAEYIKSKPFEDSIASHSYDESGVYTATLTVTDQGGNYCSDQIVITIV